MDRLRAKPLRAELAASLEQHLDRGIGLRLPHEQPREPLPGLDLLRQRVRSFAKHRDRAVLAALAQRRVRDGAVAVPRVEVLPGRREQRREALVDLDAVGLDGEHLAVQRDRAAPLAPGARAGRLFEDHFTVESRVREAHSDSLSLTRCDPHRPPEPVPGA